MKKNETQEKVIEVPSIRLSADETRLVLRAQQSNGKPVESYHDGESLAHLGLMKKAPLSRSDAEKAIKSGWVRLRSAVSKSDLSAASAAVANIQSAKRKTEKCGFVLTDLGKQVARGITVRLASQYRR